MEVRSNWLFERSARKRQLASVGAPEVIEYAPVFDKSGVWHLEETGKRNVYLEIQSHADSCDLNVIMARYRNGETDVLSRVQGVYGDLSEIPTNYAEIMNARMRAEKIFAGLAPDVRAKFNNSVEQFMAQIGTKEGLAALGYKFEDEQPVIEPIEKKEVSENA